MNLPEPVDTEFPWEKDHGIFQLKENSLCFTCFVLDPQHRDTSSSINDIYKELVENELKPWLESYIWSVTIPNIEIRHDHNEHFIFGSLEFGENLIDEWLITSLLYDFSSRYPNLYIHIFDNEGEFLFIELSDNIPEFLDTNSGLNRPWINNKRLVIIPNDYHPDRNLSLKEGLEFLKSSSSRLLNDDVLNKELSDVLNEYPEKALENIFKIEIEVGENIALVLCNNKKSLSSFCIQESIANIELKEETVPKQNQVKLTIQIPALCYLNLIAKDLLGDSGKIGILVENGLSKLTTNGLKINEGVCLSQKIIEDFEMDQLQTELLKRSKIEDYVESKYEFEKPTELEDNQREEDLINRLQEIFQNSSTFEGISSKVENSYNDDSDYSSDAEDESVRKYFKDENIDIDEDDFFEFFCKEALHLNEEDLEKFRHLKQQKEENEVSSDEEDDDETGDDDGADLDFDPETVQNLLQALKMEQGNGPMSTLLNSFK